MPSTATEAKAVPAATAVMSERLKLRDAVSPLGVMEDRFSLFDLPNPFVACTGLDRAAPRRKLREENDDNDQADHTVAPPSSFPEINNRLRRTFEVREILL